MSWFWGITHRRKGIKGPLISNLLSNDSRGKIRMNGKENDAVGQNVSSWWIWVKGLCKFFVLSLQLFHKYKIISKYKFKKYLRTSLEFRSQGSRCGARSVMVENRGAVAGGRGCTRLCFTVSRCWEGELAWPEASPLDSATWRPNWSGFETEWVGGDRASRQQLQKVFGRAP